MLLQEDGTKFGGYLVWVLVEISNFYTVCLCCMQGVVYHPRFAGVLSLNMLHRSFADSSQVWVYWLPMSQDSLTDSARMCSSWLHDDWMWRNSLHITATTNIFEWDAETWVWKSGVVYKMSKGRSAVASMKESANKEMDSAKDSMNEMPDKVKQTAEELMEVSKEAAKALKRDTERLAEVVGIKEKKPGDLDRTEF